MTDDLERELRTMLTERAGDIGSVPGGVVTVDTADGAGPGFGDDVLELGLRGADLLRVTGRRWPLLFAAAAVAAILFGVLAAVSGRSTHTVPPVNHTAMPAKPVPTLQRATCAADPVQWNADVLASSFVLRGVDASQGVAEEAVTPDGDALVAYNRPGGSQRTIGSELGLLSPGSRTPHDLHYFGVSSQGSGTMFGLDVSVDNLTPTAIVSVENGRHGGLSVSTIYALNLDSGHRTLLMSQSNYGDGQLQQGFVRDGMVYWEVDPPHAAPSIVYAVPVSGGNPRIVARNNPGELDQSAAGIDWSYGATVDVPADLPDVVAQHVRANVSATFQSVVTDGTAYAWGTASGALKWYTPGAGHVISFRGLLGGPADSQGIVNAVAGPLIYFQSRNGYSQQILDTRTGGLLKYLSGTIDGALGGVAVGDPLLANGRDARDGQLMRLGTHDLARLRC